jgi:hypothetical protein
VFSGSFLSKTSERNRELFSAYEAGRTIKQLSENYGLTEERVRTILTDEKLKLRFSTDPFYRKLRGPYIPFNARQNLARRDIGD